MNSPTSTKAADGAVAQSNATSWWRAHWQKAIAALLWAVLIGGYLWYSTANNLGPLEAVRQLLDLFRTSAVGPLIYLAIYMVRPLIFFSAAVLTLAAGFVFGPVWGVIYATLGGNLSASLAYFIGYFFGEGVLEDDGTDGILQRYARRMRGSSFETVLIMRFLFLPFDPVSYLVSFLRGLEILRPCHLPRLDPRRRGDCAGRCVGRIRRGRAEPQPVGVGAGRGAL
ncbi:MAG: VTT domain-containing protein [Caldilineaceae bacterium]